MNTRKSRWLEQDLMKQTSLNKAHRNLNPECYICWLYKENGKFYITDAETKISATINQKLTAKVRSVKSKDDKFIKIYLKHYFYSSMIDFKLSSRERYLFMFIEDFEFKDLNSVINSKLNLDTTQLKTISNHPLLVQLNPKPRLSGSFQTKGASSPAPPVNTTSAKSKNDTIISNDANLSSLINNLTQDGSFKEYTIDLVEPIKTVDSRSSNANINKNYLNLNLNEAFVKDSQQSLLPSSNKENQSIKDDFILIEDDIITSSNILNCKTGNEVAFKNNAIKLSSQLADMPSISNNIDCSSINSISMLQNNHVTQHHPINTLISISTPSSKTVKSITTITTSSSKSSILIKKVTNNNESLIKDQVNQITGGEYNNGIMSEDESSVEITNLTDNKNLSSNDDTGSKDIVQTQNHLKIKIPESQNKEAGSCKTQETSSLLLLDSVNQINNTVPNGESPKASDNSSNANTTSRQFLNRHLNLLPTRRESTQSNCSSSITSSINHQLADLKCFDICLQGYRPATFRRKRKLMEKYNKASDQFIQGASEADIVPSVASPVSSRNRTTSSSSNSSDISMGPSLLSIHLGESSASNALIFKSKKDYKYKEKLIKKSSEKKSASKSSQLFSPIGKHHQSHITKLNHSLTPRNLFKYDHPVFRSSSVPKRDDLTRPSLVSCRSTTSIDTNVIDKLISISKKSSVNTLDSLTNESLDESKTQPPKTPRRKRLYNPNTHNLESAFDLPPTLVDYSKSNSLTDNNNQQELTTTKSDSVLTTTTATTSSVSSNPTDKSIPSGQNPNLLATADIKLPNESSNLLSINSCEVSNSSSSMVVSPKTKQMQDLLNYDFGMEPNALQAYLTTNKHLIDSDDD